MDLTESSGSAVNSKDGWANRVPDRVGIGEDIGGCAANSVNRSPDSGSAVAGHTKMG